MTKPKGIGKGNAANSRAALRSAEKSEREQLSVTLAVMPAQANAMRKMNNRSGAIAAFLSQNWQAFRIFEQSWSEQQQRDGQ